ncbi:MAG TPA: DUF4258 domain-containing protein [Reyranella sp.]|nr:DUF4258 domain-containing protein [Reyranella sp.]
MKEQARIRAILSHRDKWIIWTRHARFRMEQREMTEADVIAILTRAQVTWFEVVVDETVHVEGRDPSGRKLRLVVALRDHVQTLKIITLIAPGDRNWR